MYDHTLSKLANDQIRHQATHKVGCQPGDFIAVNSCFLLPITMQSKWKLKYCNMCIIRPNFGISNLFSQTLKQFERPVSKCSYWYDHKGIMRSSTVPIIPCSNIMQYLALSCSSVHETGSAAYCSRQNVFASDGFWTISMFKYRVKRDTS